MSLESFPPLATARLVVRRFEARDAAAFSAYRSDPEVARHQGWDTPFPLDAARAFIADLGTGHPLVPGRWHQLAFARRDDDVLVGDGAVCPGLDPRVVEIGFTLARAHQGRGYAREAVARLLDYLFEEGAAHRVVAGCDVRNVRSARLLEHLGMRREAHLVEAVWSKGEWTSEYRYALLRREWVAGRMRDREDVTARAGRSGERGAG